MNSIKIQAIGAGLLAALIATPAFAQVNVGAGLNADVRAGSSTIRANAAISVETRIANGKERANREIDRRINALNALNARTQAFVRVSATVKSNISNDIAGEISNLTALKAKIAADTDLETLRADIQSIAKSYRIFVLVIPQGRITASADKIKTTADMFAEFETKLKTRIAEAKSGGVDVSSVESMIADIDTKLADARVQADTAISLVANLTPDNGDNAKMQANTKALHDAHAKLKVGLEDLRTARKVAGDIVKALRSTSESTSTTVSGEVQ